MPAKARSVLHLPVYAAIILLIAASFLAEILRGGCPVP